jgi:hypothetical protein
MNAKVYSVLKQELIRQFTTVAGSLAILYKRETGEVVGRLACGVETNKDLVPETGKIWSEEGNLVLEDSLDSLAMRTTMTDMNVCLCEISTIRKLGARKRGKVLHVNRLWCKSCKLGRKCPAYRLKEVEHAQ